MKTTLLLATALLRRIPPSPDIWRGLVLWKMFAAAVLGSAITSTALAADIEAVELDDENVAILIVGDIEPGDAVKFRGEAGKHGDVIVLLESDGGSVLAAIEIGEIIRLRGYPTAVINGSTCNSACALIWLAGSPRALSKSGRVGFHAAYSDQNGSMRESGAANALVGRYLTLLNLPEKALLFATTSPPTGMSWLDSSNHARIGIDVTLINDIDIGNNSKGSEKASTEESALWKELDTWSIFVDQTLDYGCFVASRFTNNTVFRVGIDSSKPDSYYVMIGNPAWRSLKEDQKYELEFQFGSESPWDVPAIAVNMDGDMLLVATFSDATFWAEFVRATFLDVTRQGKSITRISMNGTKMAFDELVRCQKAQNSQKVARDPFAE